MGARPSSTLEPYFKQMELVKACIDPEMKHPVDNNGRFFDWFRGRAGCNYYGHRDLGLTHDACGMALGHFENKIVIDLMYRILPKPGKEIDIREIGSYILELKARGFRITKITYDQFQSAGSIQDLRKHNINADRLSVEG